MSITAFAMAAWPHNPNPRKRTAAAWRLRPMEDCRQATAGCCFRKNSRLTLRNSRIVNNTEMGYLGAGDDSLPRGGCLRHVPWRCVVRARLQPVDQCPEVPATRSRDEWVNPGEVRTV
jgi:hypothetical protein